MTVENLEVAKRMYFFGVSTRHSSIMKVFPLWMKALGRPDVALEGLDLKLNDTPENYRRAVQMIKDDPLCVGSLVTAHKVNLLRASSDLFDALDPLAECCGEVSCISKRGNLLAGHAKDPIAGGMSFDALVGPEYFGRTGAHLLIFGAGGSAMALSLHLSRKEKASERPTRMVVVSRSQRGIDALRRIAEKIESRIEIEYHCHVDPLRNDQLMAALPEGSVVVNATGMGKDIPGSPITDAGVFPRNGVAWELNYRGELDFLEQALKQRALRNLNVEDGWLYFLHGWTQVIAQVLHIDLTAQSFAHLAELAETIRPVSRVTAASESK